MRGGRLRLDHRRRRLWHLGRSGDAPPGAAYIYVKGNDGWPTSPTASLPDPGADNKDGFGWSVAVAGGEVVVGAPREDGGMGGTYVYSRTGAVGRRHRLPCSGTRPPRTWTTTEYRWPWPAARWRWGRTELPGAGPIDTPGSAFLYIAGKHGWPTEPTVTLDDPLATDNDGIRLGRGPLGPHPHRRCPRCSSTPTIRVPPTNTPKTRKGWPTTPGAVLGRVNAE
jgi:hypothetical protein